MTQRPNDEVPGVAPERLAAYADGELGPAERAAVEAWLAVRPEARAEVEALRWLARLWQAPEPPEPSEAAWAGVRDRVETAVRHRQRDGRQRVAPRRIGTTWRLFALATGAAAVLVGVFVGQYFWPAPQQPSGPLLPVATSDDVDIVSMDAGDIGALVIGDPPVQGPLELASAEDVTVDDTGQDVEVIIRDPDQPGSPPPPMMMVPLDGAIRDP
jgi:anti-sigma-K factor RskA